MHPLLRAALFVCPAEFRRRFGTQIGADQREYRGAALFSACWNVLLAGFAMHAENFGRDVAFAIRSLARARGYALVAILAFALAIGANVAVASILDAVVLRPLPFLNGDRLVMLSQGSSLHTQISYLNGRDIEARNTTLEGVGLLRENGATITGRGRPVFLPGWTIDGTYFSVLGAHAQLGRLIGKRDLGTSNIDISDRAWRKYFSGDPRAIGKVLRMDGHGYTVVGVLPADFRDPVPSGLAGTVLHPSRDYWTAVDPHSILGESRVWTGFHGIARLAPGVSVNSAAADAKRILDADAAKEPQDFIDARGVTMVSMKQGIVGDTGMMLWMLYAAVGMVLLIACVNIANLTMARIGARERELVVRNALGAGRSRIAAQLMTELGVLAVAGGILGAAIAYGMLSGLQSLFSQILPRWHGVSLDVHMLGYAAVLVLLTAVVTGLLPAFAGASDMTLALKGAGRSGDRGAGRRLRAGLVVAEVALAVAVVVGAGLVLRSFIALTHVNVGFNPDNLAAVTITLPANTYKDARSVNAFSHRALAALRSIPGVSGAAAAIILPFEWNSYPRVFTIPGRPDPHATVTTNAVSSGFFRTMQIPMLRGRDFVSRDQTEKASTAIVNAAFARRYFGATDVIGRQIALTPFVPNAKAVPQTIVGVAGDTRASYSSLPEPQLYVPFEEIPLALFYVVRTSDAGVPIAPAISAQFARIDPTIASPYIESYGTVLARDAVRSQAAMLLFGILALLALILSLSGVYAVTAYSVEQRTQEFGIRQAIGARAVDVMRDVVRNALLQTAAGIALGIVLAAVFSRYLADLLFEISPLDPPTFAIVVAVTVGAVIAASAIPAVRAARIQPASAIRYE